MKNFTFHNPTKVIFGKETIAETGREIADFGHKKILLVAGGGSIRRNGVYDQVIRSLNKYNIEFKEAWGVKPNPALNKAEEILQIAKQENVSAILAIGGGSVIDTAKSVAAGFFTDNMWSLFADRKPVTKALDVFVVLTISATGSEMNGYAVLTNEQTQSKWNIFGPAIYPKVSIIDPCVQFSLPWHQTANGAIDAISHIQEFYFMGIDSEITIAINEAMIKTIIKCTDILRTDQIEYNARASLAWTATLALNGLSGCGQGDGDWAVHGIEHSLSAIKNTIAHGAGLGVIFPAWILYNKDTKPQIFKQWAKHIWRKDSIEEAVEAFRQKIKDWGNPTTLNELGITRDQFGTISQKVMEYGSTGNNIPLKPLDIIKILELAYE